MKCPYCHKLYSWNGHGFCKNCGKYCGCSFDPTNRNDYCSTHRPK